jgi:hypothetical protein
MALAQRCLTLNLAAGRMRKQGLASKGNMHPPKYLEAVFSFLQDTRSERQVAWRCQDMKNCGQL